MVIDDEPLPSCLHPRGAIPSIEHTGISMGVHQTDAPIPRADGHRVMVDPHGGLPEEETVCGEGGKETCVDILDRLLALHPEGA